MNVPFFYMMLTCVCLSSSCQRLSSNRSFSKVSEISPNEISLDEATFRKLFREKTTSWFSKKVLGENRFGALSPDIQKIVNPLHLNYKSSVVGSIIRESILALKRSDDRRNPPFTTVGPRELVQNVRYIFANELAFEKNELKPVLAVAPHAYSMTHYEVTVLINNLIAYEVRRQGPVSWIRKIYGAEAIHDPAVAFLVEQSMRAEYPALVSPSRMDTMDFRSEFNRQLLETLYIRTPVAIEQFKKVTSLNKAFPNLRRIHTSLAMMESILEHWHQQGFDEQSRVTWMITDTLTYEAVGRLEALLDRVETTTNPPGLAQKPLMVEALGILAMESDPKVRRALRRILERPTIMRIEYNVDLLDSSRSDDWIFDLKKDFTLRSENLEREFVDSYIKLNLNYISCANPPESLVAKASSFLKNASIIGSRGIAFSVHGVSKSALLASLLDKPQPQSSGKGPEAFSSDPRKSF